jgi:hypothetical protein
VHAGKTRLPQFSLLSRLSSHRVDSNRVVIDIFIPEQFVSIYTVFQGPTVRHIFYPVLPPEYTLNAGINMRTCSWVFCALTVMSVHFLAVSHTSSSVPDVPFETLEANTASF